MACGIRVWIGIDPTVPAWDDDHADPATVASTKTACKSLISKRNRLIRDRLVPAQRLLILKGRLSD